MALARSSADAEHQNHRQGDNGCPSLVHSCPFSLLRKRVPGSIQSPAPATADHVTLHQIRIPSPILRRDLRLPALFGGSTHKVCRPVQESALARTLGDSPPPGKSTLHGSALLQIQPAAAGDLRGTDSTDWEGADNQRHPFQPHLHRPIRGETVIRCAIDQIPGNLRGGKRVIER